MWWLAAWLLFAQESPAVEGLRALEAKNYAAAITHLKSAAHKDQKDHEALFNLALAYSLSGQEQLAIEHYRKVLELKPGLYAAELNLGILLHSTQPGAALPYLEAARKAKPVEFSPAFYLAEALYKLERFGEAAEHYAAASAADPKSAHAWIGLGRSQLRIGGDKEAQAHYEKAAAADPQFASAILEVADQYHRNEQGEAALALYSKFPDNPVARQRMGEILVGMKRYNEAIPHLEYSHQKAPTVANMVRLGDAYIREKQEAKGLDLLRQSVQKLPGDFDLRMHYARALRTHKHLGIAMSEFDRATRIKPDSQDAWSELANTQLLLNSYDQALYSLDKVKAIGPEKEGHLFMRAITLDKLKLYEPALENYRQFLARSGGKFPDQEFQARQRARIIQRILSKR